MSKEKDNSSTTALAGIIVAVAAAAITRSPIVMALAAVISLATGIYKFCFDGRNTETAEVTNNINNASAAPTIEPGIPAAPDLGPGIPAAPQFDPIAPAKTAPAKVTAPRIGAEELKSVPLRSTIANASTFSPAPSTDMIAQIQQRAGKIHYGRVDNGTDIEAKQALRRAEAAAITAAETSNKDFRSLLRKKPEAGASKNL
jgi:hypothetical protein